MTEAWRGDQHPEERPTPETEARGGLPPGAVAMANRPDGSKIPLYYCLRCEQKTVIEGRPATVEAIKKWGEGTLIQYCVDPICDHVRAVEG